MAKNKIKMKTRRTAAKRFRITGTGRIVFKKTQQSSNTPLSKSSRRIKRALRLDGEVEDGLVQQVKRMVPYWKIRTR